MTPAFTGEVHPAADAFPMMPDDELADLATDIADHGLKSPIVLGADGRLIDGRNRLAACKRAEVAPKFVTYRGDNVVSFIASVNITRRHLTASQKAMVAEAMLPHFEAEAKARQVAAGEQHGRGGKLMANLPEAIGQAPTARDEAAKATGASPRSVQTAKKLRQEAPDLAEKVVAGDKTLHAAEKEARERFKKADEGLRATDKSYARTAANAEIAAARAHIWSARSVLRMDVAFIAEHAHDDHHELLTTDIRRLRQWCDDIEEAINRPLATVKEINAR